MSKAKSPRQKSASAELTALGHRIATVRENAGLTQVELAEKVGLHSVTVSRIETAKQSVSVASLIQIAWALETTASALLSDEAKAQPRP